MTTDRTDQSKDLGQTEPIEATVVEATAVETSPTEAGPVEGASIQAYQPQVEPQLASTAATQVLPEPPLADAAATQAFTEPTPVSPPPPTPQPSPWIARPATTMAPLPPVKTGPRLGLVIWGLVLAVIGASIIAASSGLRVDGQMAFIITLAAAGLALVAAAIVAAAKRPKSS